MKQAQRLYLNAPFALFSNGATGAEFCNQYALCKHDTMFTLMMKPDHIHLYQRLPKIILKFNEMGEDLFYKCKDGLCKDRSMKIAKKAVVIISLRAIVLSRIGKTKLDNEKK